MKPASRLMIFIALFIWPIAPKAFADEIVLTSGERFTSDRIWEKDGKIRFNMHGLVVSVHKSDVASITRNDANSRADMHPESNPRPQAKKRPQPNARQQPVTKPPGIASKSHRQHSSHKDASSPGKGSNGHRKIKGTGLEGVSWHMRPTDFIGLSKISTEPVYGGVDQYWQPDGPQSLNNALLDGLVFGFWQNRLYTIMMWVDGKPGYGRLKRAVFDRYGPGEMSKTEQDRFVWAKDKTTDRLLEFDTERNIGIFWMRSRELDALVKQQFPDPGSG